MSQTLLSPDFIFLFSGENPETKATSITFRRGVPSAPLVRRSCRRTVQPLGVFIIMENLGRDKSFLQWVMMANGAAMLMGGMFIMSKGKTMKPQTMLSLGLLISAAATVGIGWSHHTVLTLALQTVSGFFYPCIHIGINTLLLRHKDTAYMGRVGGIMGPMFMASW
ncbi:hypothetical protein NST04_22345 [Paenibacillus sp. FSL H7-0756]